MKATIYGEQLASGFRNMRVNLVLTDDNGHVFRGEVNLTGMEPGELPPSGPAIGSVSSVDFNLPNRPFMKKYGTGMSGAKRFSLLVAKMTGGRLSATVPRAEVERVWNKMKPLMGGSFNSAYSNRAKDSGWVDSPKAGQYALLVGWMEILGDGAESKNTNGK